jgi:hypothetical protein
LSARRAEFLAASSYQSGIQRNYGQAAIGPNMGKFIADGCEKV